MLALSHLKTLFGIEFTGKMQKMLIDVNISVDTMKHFREIANEKASFFNAKVLTSGIWPLPPAYTTHRLPLQIEKATALFEEFYRNTAGKNGRKLTWSHQFSRGDVILLYLDRKYEVNLPLSQLSILLSFEKLTSFTIDELSYNIGMTKSELESTIKPFIDVGIIYLKDERYVLNLGFKHNKIKIKMPLNLGTFQKEESILIKEVEADQRYYLQALIVRIMKSKMMLTHSDLVTLILAETRKRFQPSIGLIKSSIESLLEKQYMDRAINDKDTYLYVS